ncbi:hypothetical protein C0J52_24999 [Blattella germanica]|nr:hypothetical protein C0J52_24999 [Blattella germanica]
MFKYINLSYQFMTSQKTIDLFCGVQMERLEVSVTVKNTIWDQFIISTEEIVFVECNSNLENNSTQLKKPVKITQLYTRHIFDEKVTHIGLPQENGQDVLDRMHELDISTHLEGISNIRKTDKSRQHNIIPKLYVNGYLLSIFVRTLKLSRFYRKRVFTRFKTLLKKIRPLHINITLVEQHKDRLVLERRELDTAMSWLSTLGGAFSALGEEFLHCAEIAGRISVQQFSLALRLGDPFTVSRCKLYFALSLVQRGNLSKARRIIEQQYYLAQTAPVVDTRLVSMCLGIWAKLKYEYELKRARKMHPALK